MKGVDLELMARGLFKQENAAQDTGGGGFKEGLIRVDASVYKVYQASPPTTPGKKFEQRPPVAALSWAITRLDEDQSPLVDGDDNPITEVLTFGLGGKSLASVNPGDAESPDDEEPTDLGVEVNTEGPTLFFKGDFKIHPKSAAYHLMQSLLKAGFKEDYVYREWAPDYKGLVCFMKTFLDQENKMMGNDGVERPVGYKVVDKIIRAPYEKKAGKGAAAGAGAGDKAASNGKGDAGSEAILKPILEALSTELDGENLTFNALSKRVSKALQAGKVDAKQHVPVLALVKDVKWLTKNKAAYDMTIDADEQTVLFGTAS